MSVIGIDFGYLTSTIAAPRKGGIEVLLNEYSKRQTASCVSLCEKNRELGDAGQQKLNMNYKNTLAVFKHLLGRQFKDEFVQKSLAALPVKTVQMEDGTVGFNVKYMNEDRVFNVIQVVGMLFTKMRTIAEKELGNKVTDCCVGVPTYFNDQQRHALVAATKLAGLDVKLFNETTAVALAYGIYKKDLPVPNIDATGKETATPRRVVFVDVGHSMTQLSYVDFYQGKLEVKSVVSDLIGGQDLDKILFEHFADEIKKTKKLDIRSNPRATIRLFNECQKLKKLMSANATPCPLNVECIMDDTDVSGKMARAEFEELAADFFTRFEANTRKLKTQIGDVPIDSVI